MTIFYRIIEKNMVAKKKMNTFVAEKIGASKKSANFAPDFLKTFSPKREVFKRRKDARVAEEARLESV